MKTIKKIYDNVIGFLFISALFSIFALPLTFLLYKHRLVDRWGITFCSIEISIFCLIQLFELSQRSTNQLKPKHNMPVQVRWNIERNYELETQLLKEQIKIKVQKANLGKIIDERLIELLSIQRPRSNKELEKYKVLPKKIREEIAIYSYCVSGEFYGAITPKEIHQIIQRSIISNCTVNVIYKGGSRPGESRDIKAIYFNKDYVWANCPQANNEIRCFKFSLLEPSTYLVNNVRVSA